jgi:hypothetical protein
MPSPFEHLHDPLADLLRATCPCGARAGGTRRSRDGQRVEQRGVLEHHPELLPYAVHLVVGDGADVFAVDPDVPARGPLEADEQAQQRGLACARAADDHGRLVALEVHGHAMQHVRRAERLLHVVDEQVIVGLLPRGHEGCLLLSPSRHGSTLAPHARRRAAIYAARP